MRPLVFIAAVLLGVTAFVQVVPVGELLAQRRPQRIGPRRVGGGGGGGGGPVAAPQVLGPNGAPRSEDPVRCISLCDTDMRTCLNRCPHENSRGCERICFTAVARCYATCPGDAATIAFDGGWHRDAAPQGPVFHTLPRR